MNPFRMNAPGSLLLAGEYAITQPGGLGLALAAGGRASLRARPGKEWELKEIFPQSGAPWHPGEAEGKLAPAVWAGIMPPGPPPPGGWELQAETRAFFDSAGRKRGYGSSAAAALLFTAGLQRISSQNINLEQRAVQIHRRFQGGGGSGYDVMTSARGGLGIFTGGSSPGWSALTWPEELEAWIIRGPKTVSSSQAVLRFRRWKTENPRQAAEHFQKNNQRLGALAQAFQERDIPVLWEIFKELRNLGEKLGDLIGVAAAPQTPPGFPSFSRSRGLIIKSLGAGNEILMLLTRRGNLSRKDNEYLTKNENNDIISPLNVEKQGLKELPWLGDSDTDRVN